MVVCRLVAVICACLCLLVGFETVFESQPLRVKRVLLELEKRFSIDLEKRFSNFALHQAVSRLPRGYLWLYVG